MLCSGWYHHRSTQFLNSDTFCSFPAWIFLYIINASPRRGSCLQLLSKARADTELPLLLTKRLSDRGCTSNTESKEKCRGSNNVRGKWGGRGKEGGGGGGLNIPAKLGWLTFPSFTCRPKNRVHVCRVSPF